MQQRVIHWFGQHWAKIVLAALLGALASIVALYRPGLREDFSIAAFVGSDNAEFDTFQEFIATFGGSELALIAVRGQEALGEETLACLDEIVPQLEQIPAVRQAGAISQLPRVGRSLLLKHPLVRGVLVSHDERTAAIILQMRGEDESGGRRRQTVTELRRIVANARAQHATLEIILSGPYVTMLEMFEFVREDLRLLSMCVGGLMFVVLYVVIGSWRTAFFAVGVAAAAVLCTLGGTIAAGVNMSLTTQMIVIMVAILSVATCVHLAVGHREVTGEVLTARRSARAEARGSVEDGEIARAKARGSLSFDADLRNSTTTVLRRLGIPCTAVILTSAAGFGSVCISEIQPIRDFGVIMVFGLLFALVLAFAALFLLRREGGGAADPRAGLHGLLAERLGRTAEWALHHKGTVVVVFVAAAIVLAIPIPRLRFESDFVKNFRADSAVRRGYEFIEANLAPLGSIELVVRSKSEDSIINVHAVGACDRVISHAVEAHEPITTGISVLDVLRLPGVGLPTSEVDLQVRFKAAEGLLGRIVGPDAMSNFVTDDLSTLRISLRAREGASVWRKMAMADDVRRTAAAAFGPGYEITVTGLYYFYATLMAGLLHDQNTTFVITLIAIFVITALCLRSWKLAAIGMIPNLFPMVACLGLMGWLAIPLNMATSMMLAISLGIAVDDTIHYLWRFRRELHRGSDMRDAILRSHRSVGLACVFTTLAITGGFWILCFSRFLPTAYFGVLVGLTMITALAADLILLPILLSRWGPIKVA